MSGHQDGNGVKGSYENFRKSLMTCIGGVQINILLCSRACTIPGLEEN